MYMMSTKIKTWEMVEINHLRKLNPMKISAIRYCPQLKLFAKYSILQFLSVVQNLVCILELGTTCISLLVTCRMKHHRAKPSACLQGYLAVSCGCVIASLAPCTSTRVTTRMCILCNCTWLCNMQQDHACVHACLISSVATQRKSQANLGGSCL